MHELSVLVEVVRQIEEIAVQQKIDKIDSIVLQVGELSSIVPMFLTEYYPVVTLDKDIFKDSKLEIEMLPGEAQCDDCGEIFNVIENEGYCPKCRSFEKILLRGKEFFIKEIVVPEI